MDRGRVTEPGAVAPCRGLPLAVRCCGPGGRAALIAILMAMVLAVLGPGGALIATASATEKPGAGNAWFTVGDAEYRLDVGDGGWTRVPNGLYGDDPFMEFVGPTKDTWAVVYTMRGAWTLNDIVSFRHAELRPAVEELELTEIRTLLPETMIPVSHVRYAGKIDGTWLRATWWTSVIVTDTGGVEVLASTMSGPVFERQIEALVKSLRVRLPEGN